MQWVYRYGMYTHDTSTCTINLLHFELCHVAVPLPVRGAYLVNICIYIRYIYHICIYISGIYARRIYMQGGGRRQHTGVVAVGIGEAVGTVGAVEAVVGAVGSSERSSSRRRRKSSRTSRSRSRSRSRSSRSSRISRSFGGSRRCGNSSRRSSSSNSSPIFRLARQARIYQVHNIPSFSYTTTAASTDGRTAGNAWRPTVTQPLLLL